MMAEIIERVVEKVMEMTDGIMEIGKGRRSHLGQSEIAEQVTCGNLFV